MTKLNLNDLKPEKRQEVKQALKENGLKMKDINMGAIVTETNFTVVITHKVNGYHKPTILV